MKANSKITRKVISGILSVSILSGLCVTAGLLTTSAAALAPGDKVIDLSLAKTEDAASVKLSGELASGAKAQTSSRFSGLSYAGLGVIGTSAGVKAGDTLSLDLIDAGFGKLGDKIYSEETKNVVGDGFKATVYVPSDSPTSVVGMKFNLVNEKGETETYFCEQQVEKGKKQDVMFKYSNFKRPITDKDRYQYDKEGRMILPPPENYTEGALPEYWGANEYGYLGLTFTGFPGSYRCRMNMATTASVYVKADADGTGAAKFYVSDITMFENPKDPNYLIRWKDNDVTMNGDQVFGAGDLPFLREMTDTFSPNSTLRVSSERYLYESSFYINPVTGEKVENSDMHPMYFTAQTVAFNNSLIQGCNVAKDGLAFKIKQDPEMNASSYAATYTYGIGLMVANPNSDAPDGKWFNYYKILSIEDVIDMDTMQGKEILIKAPLKAFQDERYDPNDVLKLSQEDMKYVKKVQLFTRSEYYKDSIMTLDMEISDICKFSGKISEMPEVLADPVKVEYPIEADDPINNPNPSETTAATTTTTVTTAESTTTTTDPIVTESSATTEKPTTTTTVTNTAQTTATTPKPTQTITTTQTKPVETTTTTKAAPTEPSEPDEPSNDDPTEPIDPVPSDTEAPDTTAPAEETPSDNPNTGVAAPMGLTLLIGAAGMTVFFTKKKKR